MKITKKYDDGCTYFRDLARGDIFFYQNHAYMKIPTIKATEEEYDINAVSLEDGYVEAFGEAECVKKVEAELVVEF